MLCRSRICSQVTCVKFLMIFRTAVLLLFSVQAVAAPVPTAIAAGGQAKVQIVVSETASGQTRLNVDKFADLLSQITGARFQVVTGDGSSGIAIGNEGDFPSLQTNVAFEPKVRTRQEDYLIRTHAKGAWLLGATDLGTQNAVWDFLHRLGYRHYFPGEAWEVIPQRTQLDVAIDTIETPNYLSRRIWYGYGIADYAKQPYLAWCEKNRCVPSLQLNTGHAYGRIVKAMQSEFDTHPEYLPLIKGERRLSKTLKPELGNPELRQKIVEYALNEFRKSPGLDSISMDPSDGGDWSESPESARLGSVSDQVVTLANEVAAAVNKKHPGKLVGIYAYNYHAPPPSINVHPNVVVSIATAFIKGGFTVDELMSGWSAKGASLGIREYYSVNTWDRDQPGHARGSNLDYLQRTIPHFHQQGARFMSAEASDNWGPNGLGYWFATRVLWDIREAAQKDTLVSDFLQNAFGPAHAPMREFYEQIDGSKPKLVVDDQLGRMFRALSKASDLADTPAIRRRINELTLYAHYAALYQRYAKAKGPERQNAFEDLIRHAWRMRKTMLVHTRALYRDLANRDKSVSIPVNAAWQVAEDINPWKSSEPFTEAEFKRFREEGTASHPLVTLTFAAVSYSSDLIPVADRLRIPATLPAPPVSEFSGRGVQAFTTFVRQAPTSIELKVTGGLIPHYRDRGNVKIELYKLGGTTATGDIDSLVDSNQATPPDGKEHQVTLTAQEPGLYRVVVSDGKDRTNVQWPEQLPMAIASTLEHPMNDTYGGWTGYFYVPKGTRVIGLFGGGHGEVLDSENRVMFWLNGRERNYYSLEVPKGQDGQFWRVRHVRGALRLLTVPPLFSPTPQQLLLPREVVSQDASS